MPGTDGVCCHDIYSCGVLSVPAVVVGVVSSFLLVGIYVQIDIFSATALTCIWWCAVAWFALCAGFALYYVRHMHACCVLT